ncbi:MAG: recombinase family protein [Roseburia sp.]|nr:recombinase family protein [Roseburia sp.]
MKYGYMRISTQDKQEFTRQKYALHDCNLDCIFEEKISGTKKACGRVEFNKMLELIKEGDEVYFESMSRMARSMQDLIDTTNIIVKEKKARVIFLKENLTIGDGKGLDAMGALIFHVMGAFAQFERDMTADRVKQALAAKKASGITLGRPRLIDDDKRNMVISMHEQGKYGYQIAEELGISTATVSNILKEYKGNERDD